MPHYLHQVAYSREGWEALLAHPQNRIEAVRPAIEKLGGKLETAWFAFGEYDVVVVTELPDNVSAAAIAMAFAGGGSCKADVPGGSFASNQKGRGMRLSAGNSDCSRRVN